MPTGEDTYSGMATMMAQFMNGMKINVDQQAAKTYQVATIVETMRQDRLMTDKAHEDRIASLEEQLERLSTSASSVPSASTASNSTSFYPSWVSGSTWNPSQVPLGPTHCGCCIYFYLDKNTTDYDGGLQEDLYRGFLTPPASPHLCRALGWRLQKHPGPLHNRLQGPHRQQYFLCGGVPIAPGCGRLFDPHQGRNARSLPLDNHTG